MTRELESAAHPAIAELTSVAQALVDDGELGSTIEDHARRLRSIAEGLARALPGADAQPARQPPARRARPPIDHDRP
jgi:hypothetical protein